jgi:hypothetical protein
VNDLERDLRELLGSKAGNAAPSTAPSPGILRRARRRQVGTVITTLVVVAAVIVGSVAALQTVLRKDPSTPQPATPPVLPEARPGFSSAALPFASIAYPTNWYLLDTSPLVPLGVAPQYVVPSGPVLQLANFDPDLPHSPRCMVDPDALPSDGVLLTVGLMTAEEAAISNEPIGPWPVELTPLPENQDPVCVGGPRPRIATWTAPSGLIYWANAGHGADASEADIRKMEQAFSSLTFPPSDLPQMSRMAAFQGQGTPRVVLGTERIGSGIATIVAYVELNKSLLVGVSGSEGGSCCSGSAVAPHSGSTQEPVTSSAMLSPDGTLLYGVISPEVVDVELRTSSGDSLPVNVVGLPPSMGYEDRVVWGIAPGADDRATIVGYDADGNALGNPILPAGPRVTIATGNDPEGGPWILYLEPSTDGTGLGFGFEGGGGSGCCLKPLTSDFRLDGWGSGGDQPSDITALASDAVTRVVFEPANGDPIEGALYPVPDESLGIPQVALVIVPSHVPLGGQLVAYDADANEVGRVDVGDVTEPSGPTTEIDIVWTRLRRARDTVDEYAARHDGSLEGFDASAAGRIDPGIGGDPGIRWNDGSLQAGDVSIRGVQTAGGSELTGLSGWTVVLVSATVDADGAAGSIYCLGVNIDENGGSNFRYGTQDAASYEECRGGWPGLGG